ncbi:MAG: phosphodiester glycosidase family protein [Halanaerobiales bacterium]
MNKSKMNVKNGSGIFKFINEMGLTDVVKLDGGGSTQMYANSGYYFQYKKRAIPNMILITGSK